MICIYNSQEQFIVLPGKCICSFVLPKKETFVIIIKGLCELCCHGNNEAKTPTRAHNESWVT